jgi:hypothetical protein
VPERNIEIRSRNRGKILRNVLLRVGVVPAPELRIDGRRLVGRQTRASAKRHVLLGMGHPRKSGWGECCQQEGLSLERRTDINPGVGAVGTAEALRFSKT